MAGFCVYDKNVGAADGEVDLRIYNNLGPGPAGGKLHASIQSASKIVGNN